MSSNTLNHTHFTRKSQMIDIDKCKAAFAGSTLCQREWYKPGTDINPAMLCAISALTAYAGVHPDLVGKFAKNAWGLMGFAMPVLEVEYGIPQIVARRVPEIFDKQENEWRAVEAVLALFETHNMGELHAEAIREDAVRFPQGLSSTYIIYSMDGAAYYYSDNNLNHTPPEITITSYLIGKGESKGFLPSQKVKAKGFKITKKGAVPVGV